MLSSQQVAAERKETKDEMDNVIGDGSGERATGTANTIYDLSSVLFHALEGGASYDTYIDDAERERYRPRQKRCRRRERVRSRRRRRSHPRGRKSCRGRRRFYPAPPHKHHPGTCRGSHHPGLHRLIGEDPKSERREAC
jgi:hypothetical protein